MCTAQLSERGCPGTAPYYKLCPTHALVTRSLQVRSCDHENPCGDTPELTHKELESSTLPHHWVRQVEKCDVQCHKELQHIPKELPLDAHLSSSPSKIMPRLFSATNSNGYWQSKFLCFVKTWVLCSTELSLQALSTPRKELAPGD